MSSLSFSPIPRNSYKNIEISGVRLRGGDGNADDGGNGGSGGGGGGGGGSSTSGERTGKIAQVTGTTGYDDKSVIAAVNKDKGKGKVVDIEGEKGKEEGVCGIGRERGGEGEDRDERRIYGTRNASGSRGDDDNHDGDGDNDQAEDDIGERFDSEGKEERQSEDQEGDGNDNGHGDGGAQEEEGEDEYEGDEEHLISDPLSDPQERKALTSALSSYFLYRRTAHLNLTHQRRKGYLGLPRRHRDVLEQAMRGGKQEGQEDGRGYLAMLGRVDQCIERNAEVAEGIFASGMDAFGIPAELGSEADDGGEGGSEGNGGSSSDGEVGEKPVVGRTKGDDGKGWWEKDASNEDIDKVKSTLKQLYRDWAKEGEGERVNCYKPVLDELCDRFPLDGEVGGEGGGGEGGEREAKGGVRMGCCSQVGRGGKGGGRDQIRVLVPGAGLGRLAFDIVRAGFESQGNEFSYHQLVASNFILNCFSHHLTRENHLRAVTIPDVHPGNLLINPTCILPHNPYCSSPAPPAPSHPAAAPAATRFSMIAGDFLQCYAGERSQESFDAVATVFFIDTAPNVIAYIETIHRVLKPGGVWINLGPLLWHWEGRDPPKRKKSARLSDEVVGIDAMGAIELTLEEVLAVVEACGFRVEKRGVHGDAHAEGMAPREVRTGYIQDEKSMLNYEYRAQFWVAVRI